MNRVLSILQIGTVVVLTGALVSCGSARNDQGVSFTQIGYFSSFDPSDPAERAELCDVGLSGAAFPLSLGSFTEPQSPYTNIGQALFQNHLIGQTIRIQGITLEYFVPGADTQPPSSFVPVSGVLGPTTVNVPGGGSTSLPGTGVGSGATGGTGNPNLLCLEFILVPESITQWMSLNRDQLPQAPFEVVLTTVGVGVTSAGESIDTNPLTLSMIATEDNTIPPTPGT